jgi:hypothetical protein
MKSKRHLFAFSFLFHFRAASFGILGFLKKLLNCLGTCLDTWNDLHF